MMMSANAQNSIADEITKANNIPIKERCDKVTLYPNKSIEENYKVLKNVLSLHRENNYAKYSIKVYGNYNNFIYELWELKIKPKELYLGDINEYIICAITSIYTTSYEKPFKTPSNEYIDVGVNRKIVSVPTGRTFKTKDGKVIREYVKEEISQNTVYHLLSSSNLYKQIKERVRKTIYQLDSSMIPKEKDVSVHITEQPMPKVYDVVEQMPSFHNGMGALMKWIEDNMKYPVIAAENGVQGRVVVGFIVEKDGSVTDVHIAKSIDPSLDKEAIRLVESMPKWIPGKSNGSNVRCKYTIPITFKL